MKTGVVSVDGGAWPSALAMQPQADAYFLPEYHAAAEANGDGEALAFVATNGDNVLLHPFLLRPIESGGSDIESVYGYTGPLATTGDEEFLAAAWREFDAWCADRGVVAEFVRFNPLSRNERVGAGRFEVSVARQSIVVDPSGDPPASQRTMLRRALREGLVARELETLDDFLRLYEETMQRVGADSRYLFAPAYYTALRDGLGGHLRCFGVERRGEVVAAALFLLYGDRMHYHLAGSSAEARRGGANNLLLHEAGRWGSANGVTRLHLGGGLTDDPNDPLFRFKSSISTATVPAYVGRRVHDREAYDALCDAWLQEHGREERPQYFLLWRIDG